MAKRYDLTLFAKDEFADEKWVRKVGEDLNWIDTAEGLHERCNGTWPQYEIGVVSLSSLAISRAETIEKARVALNIRSTLQGHAESPGLISVRINLKRLQYDRKYVGDNIAKLVDEISSAASIFYGFVDVCDAWLNGFGSLYQGTSITSEVHRRMEQYIYQELGSVRRHFVRNVYWGNYLGPDLRQLFDPTGELVREFRVGVDPDYDPSEDEEGSNPYTHYAHETQSGGVFLAMSHSPLTWSVHHGGFQEFGESWGQAQWLYMKFRERGVLL